MPDHIRLLPDSIANQIAAGEVVQRPASVVKELLENAIDAGCSQIKLMYRDGGQTLIEVIDDGKGMNETDARMAWERHATSKIENAQDLFSLSTFGFRGEALASIAAVAQVEMKTREPHAELGTFIAIEASELRKQEAISCPSGTGIRVKNLFYNIPARKKFLKSAAVEGKHIIEIFEKIALAYPEIAMSLYHGDQEVYKLLVSSPEGRIGALIGEKRAGSLIRLDEHTDIVAISGYVGAPLLARKTRGEQYFFVNRRFIRNPYFQHAVQSAYEALIDADSFPFFALFLEIDPARIDVNVHPTKTEIKFEETQAIYSILKSVVRRALGNYHHSPELDDLTGSRIDFGTAGVERPLVHPAVRINPSFNPFERAQKPRVPTEWEKLYEPFRDRETVLPAVQPVPEQRALIGSDAQVSDVFQISQTLAVCNVDGNLFIIHLPAATERILFEKYRQMDYSCASQQLLFPRTVEFSPSDFSILCGVMEELNAMGFDLSPFGKNTVIINGTPADMAKGNETEMLQGIMDNYKNNLQNPDQQKREQMARAMARSTSMKMDRRHSVSELNELIQTLLKTEEPAYTPGGKPTFIKFDPIQLHAFFRK